MYYTWYLLKNYGIDEEVTYFVNNREMYFAPVLNVDGYMYNQLAHPSGGGMWRENGRDNGDSTYGVDLNRNYGYMWGYDDIGSSPETRSNFYRGKEYFLTEGTLYDVAGDSLMSPRSIMGTLKYDNGEYQINLESGIWEDYYHNFFGEYYDDMMFTSVVVGGFADPCAPQDLVITIQGDNVKLDWSPVTEDVNGFPIQVDEYRIYRSETNPYFTPLPENLIGMTGETSYLDGDALLSDKYFYIVTAVYQGRIIIPTKYDSMNTATKLSEKR